MEVIAYEGQNSASWRNSALDIAGELVDNYAFEYEYYSSMEEVLTDAEDELLTPAEAEKILAALDAHPEGVIWISPFAFAHAEGYVISKTDEALEAAAEAHLERCGYRVLRIADADEARAELRAQLSPRGDHNRDVVRALERIIADAEYTANVN